jgi:hypothetical protein
VLWGDQTRTEGITAATKVDLKRQRQLEIRYVPVGHRDTVPGGFRNDDQALSVTVYAPEATGAREVGNRLPYKLVVVSEEREGHRWGGAPRKLCHALTYEVMPSGHGESAASASAAFGVNKHSAGPATSTTGVLLLGLRDCRTKASDPPKIMSREWFLELVAKSSPGNIPIVDATSNYRELLPGYYPD